MRIFCLFFLVSALSTFLQPPSACAGVNIENFEHTSSYSFENLSGARVLESYLPIEDSLLLGVCLQFTTATPS